jgi:hypothetical protein
MFVARGRRVKFLVPLPTMEEAEAGARRKNAASGSVVPDSQKEKWIEQESRRRWRSLLLSIKAKLEAVETGIASFDEEFLSRIVASDGMTIYEKIQMLAAEGKRLLPVLEEPGKPG